MIDYHMVAEAVITSDLSDEFKDVLLPLGCDYSGFLRDPWVSVFHIGSQDGNRIVVGHCRKSASSPTEFEMRHWGVSVLPTVRIYFNPDPIGIRTFEKVADGFYGGVSVELSARVRDIEPRSCGGRLFKAWRLRGISIVRRPANSRCVFSNVRRVPKTDAELISEELERRRRERKCLTR